ncbi:hypothetical protein RRF57_001178 [Xylaria bambusicola]|uniref:ATP-grasp domain-containing protein n=1 Tax=Xylaria bambusicola TaxID=326684 RepID=A0AAN7Z1D9_9PEZI
MEGIMALDHINSSPQRPIKRLLVANRGEIAKRVIDCARELSLETFALITSGDTSHALGAAHVLPIASSATYVDTAALIDLVKHHRIDAVHPGYGFLSESADFAQRMRTEAEAIVVGPGWDVLRKTGDKLAGKLLVQQCGVPTLPAMDIPSAGVEDIRQFVRKAGLPVMLKAVDCGGGKGIRLVRQESDLESAAKRAIAESPSHRIFAEKAAVDGFRHIEVQIIGDGSGKGTFFHVLLLTVLRYLFLMPIQSLGTIQRRYQKIIEQAPSTIKDGDTSLDTFEFLVNADRGEFFFLKVNPRLQMEHTVTECIAQGESLADTELKVSSERDWTLSIGRVEAFSLPTGHGVRVDTHLSHFQTVIVEADFDSLLAKIVVTGESRGAVISKCRRALEDTRVEGLKTNLDILRAIVLHDDFERSLCDTSWLERCMIDLLMSGSKISRSITNLEEAVSRFIENGRQPSVSLNNSIGSTIMLRKGDAWAL